ncbi:MAG: RES family NAD+ phosphorylase [Anaerolineales bacterium]
MLKASGRWNRPGEYGCIYTALTRQGAEAEYEKFLFGAGVAPEHDAPRDLVTINADIRSVLDQTSQKEALVDLASPFLTGDTPEDWEKCRNLADAARHRGHAGILAPSAAIAGEKNLVIYIGSTARKVEIKTGGKRIPMNY